MAIIYQANPQKIDDIYKLYNKLGWNDFLKLDSDALNRAMKGSFSVLYVYDDEELVGTGRVVSDGIITAYICGIGVLESYRKQGIGSDVLNHLVAICMENNLHIQLVCEEHLVAYYKKLGFKTFTRGMKY